MRHVNRRADQSNPEISFRGLIEFKELQCGSGTKDIGALHKLVHLNCCVGRQGKLHGARSRLDKVGHDSDLLKLRVACLRQQTEHNVFKSDHPDAELDQLSSRKCGNILFIASGGERFLQPAWQRSSFVFLPGQRALLFPRIHDHASFQRRVRHHINRDTLRLWLTECLVSSG